jgi:hypothetical protein
MVFGLSFAELADCALGEFGFLDEFLSDHLD